MTKLICISPRLLVEDNVEKQFVNTRYIDPLTQRGVNTLLLTLGNPDQASIFEMCDAFLLTGGVDLDPSSYDEKNHGLSKDTDLRLDQIDKEIINYAKIHHKPLLGICRGHQALNVFLGGSLYQDLGALNHIHQRSKNHILNVNENHYFDFTKEIEVNSFHHQAIKKLSEELDIIAYHNDQTIEMVYHRKLPIFSIQWHPEMNPDSIISRKIFDYFIKIVNNDASTY